MRLSSAREFGEAATLLFALGNYFVVQILCRNQATAWARAQEQTALAEEKDTPFWKAFGMMNQGCALALMGASGRAIELLRADIAATRTTNWLPFNLLHLARAHADLGQFEDAWSRIDEALTAVEKTRKNGARRKFTEQPGTLSSCRRRRTWRKRKRISSERFAGRPLQQAKSWELRAATSLAGLWQGQGKSDKGPRSPRPSLWLVHRRLRYPRLKGGQSSAQ